MVENLKGRVRNYFRAQYSPETPGEFLTHTTTPKGRRLLFGNRRNRHWTYKGTIYSVASGPRRPDVRLADITGQIELW
jgi:hypothetical protein